MKLDTINVIEESEGEILGIASFTKNAEGRKEAQERLMACVRENHGIEIPDEEEEPEDFKEYNRLLEKEVKEAVKNGGWWQDEGYYSVVILDSTE